MNSVWKLRLIMKEGKCPVRGEKRNLFGRILLAVSCAKINQRNLPITEQHRTGRLSLASSYCYIQVEVLVVWVLAIHILGTEKVFRESQVSFMTSFRWRDISLYVLYEKWKRTWESKFNLHGSVHRKNILIYIQQDANVTQFILSGNCFTCFGWYHHPSSGAQTTVSTVSGIYHTVIVICRSRGRAGTCLSVLLVVICFDVVATASKQKQISTPPTEHSNQFQLFHDSSR